MSSLMICTLHQILLG